MSINTFNPEDVSQPPPTYRQVATTPVKGDGRLIFLAGQTGILENGKTADNFLEQVKQAYENVLRCLKAAGASPKDIVHVRHYIVQDSQDPQLNTLDVVDRGWGDIWIKFMQTHAGNHLPPDTVLGVASLAKKNLLYEVECWAYATAS